MKSRARWLGAAGAIVLASSLSVPVGAVRAHADSAPEHISATEVELALDAAGSRVAEPMDIAKTAAGDSLAVTEAGSITIPEDPSAGINLTTQGFSVSISLPVADGASDGVILQNGTVAYPSSEGIANAAVATDYGVQLLTTLSSPEAPERLVYEMDVPQGGALVLNSDGTAMVVDDDGEPFLFVATPWAVDAVGTAVPTHYEVEGTRLIQVISHVGGPYTYPIVADPYYGFAWWGVFSKLTRSETRDLALRIGTSAAGIAAFCGYVPVVQARVICGVAIAWRISSWIDPIKQAAAQGRCAQINVPYASGPALWNVTNERC